MHAILDCYPIGTVRTMAPAGGTAGRTWRVSASRGEYFLRLRGIRTSSEARLRFDHGLREHLRRHGVPTAVALLTRGGERWRRHEGRVYELYPFVDGLPFDPRDDRHLAEAARALARFHLAAASFDGVAEEGADPVAQYTTLGVSEEVSDRMDDPRLQLLHLNALRGSAVAPADLALLDRCTARVQALSARYAGEAYRALAGWVIHGDYTPANLLFTPGGGVAGIFDLDWAYPGARCRDVADGMYFFAAKPRALNASDIWSLTQAADMDAERCRIFLGSYQAASPLSSTEFASIPAAFTGRWISVRLEGMAKVAPAERFRFFSRDIESPLQWLDANWPRLKASG